MRRRWKAATVILPKWLYLAIMATAVLTDVRKLVVGSLERRGLVVTWTLS